MKSRVDRMTQHRRSWDWTVHYWKTHKGFGARKTRKFRTFDDAKHFVSYVHDDGCETWMFGPDCPNGDTWNGSSKF